MVRDSAGRSGNDDTYFLPGPGAVLNGRYRLERLFASRGGDALWHATDLSADAEAPGGTPVLIKFYQQGLRFEQWAAWLAALVLLDADVVPRLHCIGRTPAACYVVTDTVTGIRLDGWIGGQRRARSSIEVEPLLRALADAIERAHARSIVLRTLKPSSICFDTPAHRVELFNLDLPMFGPDVSQRVKQYASPEAIRGECADVRDDVFSYTCIAYELLSGILPFGSMNPAEAAAAGAAAAPLAHLTERQNRALAGGLARTRSARTMSVREVLHGLRPERHPAPGGRSSAIPAAFGAAMILTAGALSWGVESGSIRADRPLLQSFPVGAGLEAVPTARASSIASESAATMAPPSKPLDATTMAPPPKPPDVATMAPPKPPDVAATAPAPKPFDAETTAAAPKPFDAAIVAPAMKPPAWATTPPPPAPAQSAPATARPSSAHSAAIRARPVKPSHSLAAASHRLMPAAPMAAQTISPGASPQPPTPVTPSLAPSPSIPSSPPASAVQPSPGRAGTASACPACNCSQLLYQRSFTAEPLRIEEQRFLREQCEAAPKSAGVAARSRF